MVFIQKIDPVNLDAKMKSALQAMTESRFYPCLDGKHPDDISNTAIIILVALENDEPIGLLLGTVVPTLQTAELHSLFVDKFHRNKKIAQQLIGEFEKELKRQKAFVVTFLYAVENEFSTMYEHVFQQLDWEKPKLFSINCMIKNTFDAPWLKKELPLPEGFHELHWSDLTSQEKEQMKNESERNLIPAFLSPFGKDENIIEPANSLVLTHGKKVVGWMITHRIAPDTIRYTSLFIIPEWQRKGPAMRLLCDAIKFQTSSSIPWALFETNIALTDKAWQKALEERLMPYAHSTTHINQIWKKL